MFLHVINNYICTVQCETVKGLVLQTPSTVLTVHKLEKPTHCSEMLSTPAFISDVPGLTLNLRTGYSD